MDISKVMLWEIFMMDRFERHCSEIPDLYEQIRHGEFDRLNKWMKEHIWQYGCCYTSGEMLKRLTGKTLDVVPFLDYMKEKYADLYGIHI